MADNNDRTAQMIQHAFWDLFQRKPLSLITLREVADRAKVPVEDVTSRFNNSQSILRSIEDNQIVQLEELFDSYDWRGLDFSNLYEHFQKYFYENEDVLFPLVMDHRDIEFANDYRAILEDRLFKDLNIYTMKKNNRAPEVVEYLIECFIEMFLIGVSRHGFGKEEVALLANGLMREGFENVLREEFGVVFKIIYREDRRPLRMDGFIYWMNGSSIMLDGGVRTGGPIPKFNDYHIWKALNYLSDKEPVGRKKLASVLGIGEGSTRTILNIMQDENLISIGKSGIFLTNEGIETKKKLHMDVVRIPAGDLTIGDWDCAVRVPRMARNVKYGCEERDRAIISGARGATTLVYTNNKLMFAGEEYPVDEETENKIKAVMTLRNEDVVIIGTGPDPESAENGAVAAGLYILGGLGFGKEDKVLLSPNINGNELISLAFAIHDLVGGLPVCAKSKNNLGIRIEDGRVVDNAYTGEVLEEVIEVGTTIRRIATSGPYKGIRVIVTPIEMDSRVIASIGVVDIRTMAGKDNLIRLRSDEE